ncbi:isoprenoid biosynthesis glyoxalase ElbB [Halomonas caseinilytica]|uniref:isoprenoid biosynthesis glyoxalase ElbB n=1 Tax=Halomonas caseinilytica TaxID=438744 RepID=UPI0007E588F7|nr:isoprenoid biosynthesis glyoxalase ElbB [Halomonas caseinilytica]SEM01865.1 Enhancing lycopene biosynthesis protein 2 [Halomonas caseinilytica]
MSKQVAVILSGCGVQDGSEIYETTLTLLRLDQLGIGYRCFAPNIDQHDVIDHRNGESQSEERRNVLVESARLARGDVAPLEELEADEFDAVILPGGFGVAKNLSTFAEDGADLVIQAGLGEALADFYEDRKPIGLMCIAPVMVPRLLGPGIAVTVGHDPSVAGAISAMGGLHRSCGVEDIVVDFENRVVTTPAYMLATRIGEAATGIFKLVDRIDELMDL